MNDDSDMDRPVEFPGSATDRAIADAVRQVGIPLSSGLAKAISDLYGGIVGDRLGEWRLKQAVKFAEATVKELRSRGLNTDVLRELPNGRIYEIVDGATKQDDVDLQQMWARLLSSYAAGEVGEVYERTFSRILRELQPVDAGTFALLCEVRDFHRGWMREYAGLVKYERPSPTKLSP